MNIIRNEKLINRNSKIGQYTSLIALVVLGGGLYISFTQQDLFVWAVGALLVGFTMSQIGMYFTNRWGRSPRPDEHLDAGLKGLTKEYNLYHWASSVSHLLVGPAGIWVLLPYHQRGKVIYNKDRWKNTGGGFLQSYMRFFGQEGLGRPDLDAEAAINAVHKALSKKLDPAEMPEIKAILVFTANEIEIEADQAPIPGLSLKKLKGFVRNEAKSKPIKPGVLESVKTVLDG